VDVEGSQPVTITVASRPATFELSGLEAKPYAYLGEKLQVTARVRNVGSEEGTIEVPLRIDAAVVETVKVTVPAMAGGAEKSVSFSPLLDQPGRHTVAVGDLPVREMVVARKPPQQFADASGRGNVGLVQGVVFWVDGKFGSAVAARDSGGVEIPNRPDLDLTGKSLTMMAWVYPMAESGHSPFITKGDYNNLKLVSAGELEFFAGGWQRGVCRAPVLPDWNDHWRHVVGVCEGGRPAGSSTLRLYCDGKLLATQVVAGETIGGTGYPWNVARNAQMKDRDLNGYVDEVRIYGRPLSEAEVQSIYRDNAAVPDDLRLRLTFDD